MAAVKKKLSSPRIRNQGIVRVRVGDLVEQDWNPATHSDEQGALLDAAVDEVDTYGVPWKHWAEILRNGPMPLTVFLTIGSVNIGAGSQLSRPEAEALGLSFRTLKVPASFTCKLLRELAVPHSLSRCTAFGRRIAEAVEAESNGNARYIGVRLDAA